MDTSMLGKIVIALTKVPQYWGLLLDVITKILENDFARELAKFARREACWVAEAKREMEKVKIYLRQLFVSETITVSATDGTETFQGAGFVIGYVHPDYKRVEESRLATGSSVYELVENGTFAQFYGSIGSRKKWTEAQVVKFYHENRDKLRKDGYATFFELEGGFVVGVHLNSVGGPDVRVYRLGLDFVWLAKYRHRIVVPQQKLES